MKTDIPSGEIQPVESSRVELLREKIHNQDYLDGAVQRIAQVLIDEIFDSRGVVVHEQRKIR
ncbi:MAG: hypothetical protein LBT11_07980 [Treponema sp.]|jgi:hypothetical protein|nr:hypothetical protein [Treponema sp.]